jgi:tRNA (cytidine/uridine-2'-O-)-methyltransferase
MALHIVLVEPEIHTNTGNIGRLSLATGCKLHLIKPLGFKLSDSRLKRAGLDYWQHIDLEVHEDYDAFAKAYTHLPKVFLTARADKTIYETQFEDEMMLVFGKESKGLDQKIVAENEQHLCTIPMYSSKIRSLNLANAVAVTVYEGLRQIKA